MTSPKPASPANGSSRYDDRTIGRGIALQTLYEVDITQHAPMDVLMRHISPPGSPTSQAPTSGAKLARALVVGVLAQRPLLDRVIERRAPDFPVETLAVIDRNLLRMALYEFGVWGDTPVAAAIDEAVELAKDFSAEGAPGFINGVLRAIAQSADMVAYLRAAEPTPEELNARADARAD